MLGAVGQESIYLLDSGDTEVYVFADGDWWCRNRGGR